MPSASGTPSAAAGGVQPLAQAGAPGVGQVREARPELVGVRADERAPAGQVDVVAHDHQRARPEARVEPARRRWSGRRSGHRAALNSSTGWMTSPGSLPSYRWKRPWSMTTTRPPSRPSEQAAGVARRRRGRPAGELRERDRDRVLDARRRGRRAPSRGRSRPRARGPSCAGRPRPARPGSAGCSIGGIGRDGSTGRVGSGVSVEGDIGPPARIDRRRSEPGASPARRANRHRDADHVPSGGPRRSPW